MKAPESLGHKMFYLVSMWVWTGKCHIWILLSAKLAYWQNSLAATSRASGKALFLLQLRSIITLDSYPCTNETNVIGVLWEFNHAYDIVQQLWWPCKVRVHLVTTTIGLFCTSFLYKAVLCKGYMIHRVWQCFTRTSHMQSRCSATEMHYAKTTWFVSH